jgi:hypothetical protein
MKHYKTPGGEVWAFELDGSQDHLIKRDMVAITPETVVTLREVRRDRRAEAQAQIVALEIRELLPRATRELMLLSLEAQASPEDLAKLPAYVKVKAFDNEIVGLRAIAIGG